MTFVDSYNSWINYERLTIKSTKEREVAYSKERTPIYSAVVSILNTRTFFLILNSSHTLFLSRFRVFCPAFSAQSTCYLALSALSSMHVPKSTYILNFQFKLCQQMNYAELKLWNKWISMSQWWTFQINFRVHLPCQLGTKNNKHTNKEKNKARKDMKLIQLLQRNHCYSCFEHYYKVLLNGCWKSVCTNCD